MIRAVVIGLSLLANAAMAHGLSAARVVDTCGGSRVVVGVPDDLNGDALEIVQASADALLEQYIDTDDAQGEADRTPARYDNIAIKSYTLIDMTNMALKLRTGSVADDLFVVSHARVDGSDPSAGFYP